MCLDDVERLGKRDADALKSRVTACTFRYKKLYQDTVTQPCYCDLVCTTNDNNPVFVDKDDRRCEIISVAPVFSGNDPFWDHFYDKELEDPHIMGAFFHFFATYEIDLNVRSKNIRFDRQAILDAKKDSMNQAHRFLLTFFKEPDCLEEYAHAKRERDPWYHKTQFRTRGKEPVNRELVVGNQKLFDIYRFWKSANNEKNCMGSKTFYQKLDDANVTKVRFSPSHQDSGSRFQGRAIQPAKVTQRLTEVYKLPLKCECFWTDDTQWEAVLRAYKLKDNRFTDLNPRF